MGQELGLDCQAGVFPLFDRFVEMGGIPVNDDGGEEVEPSRAVALSLAGAVAAFVLASDPQRVLERVMSLAFVQAGVGTGGVRKGIVQRTAQPVAPTPAKPEPGASRMNGTATIADAGHYPYAPTMTETLIGYARCSTDRQDLDAQCQAFLELGVAPDRIYIDHGLTGTNRARPGPRRRAPGRHPGRDETRRLAGSVPDAHAIADLLRERGVKLSLGRTLYDPDDPMGKMFFNILATFAEFEADLTREGMAIARAKVGIARQAAQILRPTAAGTLPHAHHRRVFRQRSRRTVLRLKTNRLSHAPPAPFP